MPGPQTSEERQRQIDADAAAAAYRRMTVAVWGLGIASVVCLLIAGRLWLRQEANRIIERNTPPTAQRVAAPQSRPEPTVTTTPETPGEVDPPAPEPRESTPEIGETVELYSTGTHHILLATNSLIFHAMCKAILAQDEVGMREMIDAGRVHMIPNGTTAKLLEVRLESQRVRLESGDFSGLAGWVLPGHVHPQKRD